MLPFSADDPSTRTLKKNPELWREQAVSLCRRHGVTVTEFSPYSAGGSLVAAVSPASVIKIIQPPYRDEWTREHWALEQLTPIADRLPVAIPRLLASGQEAGGWSYLILSRAPGIQMDEPWPRIDPENRAALMFEIGRLMAAVHRIALPDTHLNEWNEFIESQHRDCKARHERLNMPDWFTAGIDSYVDLPPRQFTPTLLTGEYTPFNLLIEERDGRWTLSGMVDFADAMAGFAEYDLIGPGVFLGAGDPRLIASLFQGYGRALDPALRRRVMSLHLLHRFSDFDGQVALPNWREKARSLEELASHLWPNDVAEFAPCR